MQDIEVQLKTRAKTWCWSRLKGWEKTSRKISFRKETIPTRATWSKKNKD